MVSRAGRFTQSAARVVRARSRESCAGRRVDRPARRPAGAASTRAL